MCVVQLCTYVFSVMSVMNLCVLCNANYELMWVLCSTMLLKLCVVLECGCTLDRYTSYRSIPCSFLQVVLVLDSLCKSIESSLHMLYRFFRSMSCSLYRL
jgi:hypothetical protein